MKRIHSFQIPKKEIVEIEESSIDGAGNTVKTLKKVEKEVVYSFFLRKPNRALNDDAALFHGVKIAEGVRAGLLTVPLLEKRNLNDGGVFSEKDKTRYLKLLEENVSLENEFQRLSVKKDSLSDEETKQKEDTAKKLTDNRIELYRLQTLQNSVFENTAENRAKNLTIYWWILFLSYQDSNGKETPFFGEGSYEEKLKKYDEYAEKEDAFIDSIIIKFTTFVSLWVNNNSLTSEDFEKFDKLMQEDAKISETRE